VLGPSSSGFILNLISCSVLVRGKPWCIGPGRYWMALLAFVYGIILFWNALLAWKQKIINQLQIQIFH